MGEADGRRLFPDNDEIARQDGHHIEDWLYAEHELVRLYA
jgi:hypothetical protein